MSPKISVIYGESDRVFRPSPASTNRILRPGAESNLCKIAARSPRDSTRADERATMINRVGRGYNLKVKSFIRCGMGRDRAMTTGNSLHYALWQTAMRGNDMESGSPRGFPFHPGVIKAVPRHPWRLWRPSYRKICSLRRRQMYLLCPVPGATAGVRKYGWNKFATKSKGERKRKDVQPICTISLSPVRYPHPILPSKTSRVQAVRLENLHPRDASARLLMPVSSLKLGIRTAINSMTNAKIFTDQLGGNTARRMRGNCDECKLKMHYRLLLFHSFTYAVFPERSDPR